MATRHSDNDGSDIFWPGYVDAVTNLVLNLLFLLTIMIVAVFMFALELGRSSRAQPNQVAAVVAGQNASPLPANIDPARENIELKREIQRLNLALARRNVQPDSVTKTVDVTSRPSKPGSGLQKAVAGASGVIVRFADEAVAFTPAEQDRLRESLKPIVASGRASISVEVPAGFSEAKRMGFYRAMAVRNLLIEMQLPNEKINVSVLEGKSNANASIVRVGSH